MRNCAILFIVFLAVMTSCGTQKQLENNYLYTVRDTTIQDSTRLPEPVIQKNDILSIRVYSMSINPATDIPYNLPEQVVAGASATTTTGFLVDQKGNIDYPRIGTLHVEGLTKEQLADTIKARLADELKNPSVMVRFTNFRVTVLGEVRNPGTYTVPIDKITILEALGLAGDVTEFGQRKTVKVMREGDGKRDIATIDLTSKSMFSSPYYYLQQNDKIFVEQTGRRERMQNQQNLVQQIGIVTGIITAVALILNFIK